MTAQPLGLARAMYEVSRPKNEHHTLSELKCDKIGKRTIVFMPTGAAVNQVLANAGKQIHGLADPSVVCRVISHNPDSFWGIASRQSFDATIPEAEGFVAFLMLKEEGVRRLADGTLNRSNPDLSLLAAQNERPAGIYTWAIFAPAALVGAIPLVYEKLCSPLYDGVSLYAWAATPDGKRFAETLGFTLGAPLKGDMAPRLHYYPRGDALSATKPLYDNFQESNKSTRPSVTIARTFEDLMRVVSIRSAVYMAEQDCPYDEEYDGNDLSATHLLGYIGNEPAGCLRIRYFGTFAKFERLAVRHEYRTSKLSFRLVRAGIELCRKKGFRRVYGHSRTDLVRFWNVFGFRTIPDRAEFSFSDVAYVEIMLDIEPDPEALRLGQDPYVIIRPEGRWNEPGILERSATRGVRPVAKVTKENRS